MNWAFSIPANSSKTSVSPTTVAKGEAYVRDPGCRPDAGRVHPLQMGTIENGTLERGSVQDVRFFLRGLEVGSP